MPEKKNKGIYKLIIQDNGMDGVVIRYKKAHWLSIGGKQTLKSILETIKKIE